MGNSLLTAARDGNIEKLESMLQDPKTNINFQDEEHGVTALMEAASSGHSDVVSFLIDRKANVHIMSKHGVPALIYAATKNHFDIVDLLAFHGASARQLNHINKGILYDRAGVDKAYAAGAARRAAAGLPPAEVYVPQKRASVGESEVASGEDASRPPALSENNALSSVTASPDSSSAPSSSSAPTTTTTTTASTSSSVLGFIAKAKNALAPKNSETSGTQSSQSVASTHPDYAEFSSATEVLRGEVEKLKAFLASGGGSQEELEEKERELMQERARVKQLQQQNQKLEAQVHQLMALKQRGESVVDETPPEWLEEKIQLLTKNKELTLLVAELKADLTKARLEAKSWKAVMDSYVNAGDDVEQEVEQDQEQLPDGDEQALDKEKEQPVEESVAEIPKANEEHESEIKEDHAKEDKASQDHDLHTSSQLITESNETNASDSKQEIEHTFSEVPESAPETQIPAGPRETEGSEISHAISEGRSSLDHSGVSQSSEILEGEEAKAPESKLEIDQPFRETFESVSGAQGTTQEIPPSVNDIDSLNDVSGSKPTHEEAEADVDQQEAAQETQSTTNSRLDIDWLNGSGPKPPQEDAESDADEQETQSATNSRLDIDWLNGVSGPKPTHEDVESDVDQEATQETQSATNSRLDIDWLNGVSGSKPAHEAEADVDQQEAAQETQSATNSRLDIDWLNGVSDPKPTHEDAESDVDQQEQEIPSATNSRLDIDWLNGVSSSTSAQEAVETDVDQQATPAVFFHTMDDNVTQDSDPAVLFHTLPESSVGEQATHAQTESDASN